MQVICELMFLLFWHMILVCSYSFAVHCGFEIVQFPQQPKLAEQCFHNKQVLLNVEENY